jgi:hypothetical protein
MVFLAWIDRGGRQAGPGEPAATEPLGQPHRVMAKKKIGMTGKIFYRPGNYFGVPEKSGRIFGKKICRGFQRFS